MQVDIPNIMTKDFSQTNDKNVNPNQPQSNIKATARQFC